MMLSSSSLVCFLITYSGEKLECPYNFAVPLLLKTTELMSILQKKEAHLDMIEGVVVDCLHAKWKAFIGARLSNMLCHLLIFDCKPPGYA